MTRYRVVLPLSNGQKPGEPFRADKTPEAALAKLLKRGAIAPISAPPLAVLPGWQLRAEKLAEVGIVTAEQFLDATIEQIATVCNVKQRTVEKWRAEVEKALVPTSLLQQPGRGG